MKLFRDEVAAAQAGRWLGSVQLAQSVPFWMGSLVALILAVSLLAYGFFGTYASKAHVNGVLAAQGGEINLAAPAAGRIAQLRVKEGETVRKGEVLMVLDTETAPQSPLAVPVGSAIPPRWSAGSLSCAAWL